MTGWLGDAYLYVKAAHLIVAFFWIAGLFMAPRFLVYHMADPVGSLGDRLWIDREARLKRIILTPALGAVWVLGLMLATSHGFEDAGWLHTKLAVLLALSAYAGWVSATIRRFAQGNRPHSERALRLANEAPALAVILIVALAVIRPF